MKTKKALFAELDEFKRNRSNELDFKAIRKWMIAELGVEELPLKGSSHIYFKHHLLINENGTGNFQVSLKHGTIGKKEIIYRKVFLNHTYKVLYKIIDLMNDERGESN